MNNDSIYAWYFIYNQGLSPTLRIIQENIKLPSHGLQNLLNHSTPKHNFILSSGLLDNISRKMYKLAEESIIVILELLLLKSTPSSSNLPKILISILPNNFQISEKNACTITR